MSTGPAFDTKEQVRQATDIVELVSGYIDLRRQGRQLVGLCPWHDDSKPSLQINPDRQSWKCWVCDIGGDAFSFVMQKEGITFPEALSMLAERAGIQIERSRGQSPVQPGGPDDKQTLFQAMSWASRQFHDYLLNSPDAEMARRYLDDRGLNEETIATFQLGFSPDQWSWLLDRAKTTSFSPAVLQACGLIGQSEKSNQWYDRFKGRVIFPILDTQQRAVGCGGRILPQLAAREEAAGRRTPAKYVNSPETRLYSKSDHLYGLNVVRDHVAKSRKLVLVEGYTDVAMAWQAGLRNVTAVLGTALNERHLRLIKRFADDITLVLDGDEAGQKRTNEVLDLFVSADVNLRILTLPEGLDPCDFLIGQGAAAFQASLDQAIDALEHKFRQETAGVDLLNDTHRANQALEHILSTIAQSPHGHGASETSSRLREQQLLSRMARQFHLEESDIRQRLHDLRKRLRRTGGVLETTDQTASMLPLNRWDTKEREVLELILFNEENFRRIVENISPDQFVMGPARDIYETFCHFFQSRGNADFQSVMTHLENPLMKNVLVELDQRSRNKKEDGNVDQEVWLEDVIRAFDRQDNEKQRRKVLATLDQAELSDGEEIDALQQIIKQKQRETELNQHGLSAPTDG